MEADEGAELVFGLSKDYTKEAFDKAVAAMKTAGIAAVSEKTETGEYIICTVKIPKAV